MAYLESCSSNVVSSLIVTYFGSTRIISEPAGISAITHFNVNRKEQVATGQLTYSQLLCTVYKILCCDEHHGRVCCDENLAAVGNIALTSPLTSQN